MNAFAQTTAPLADAALFAAREVPANLISAIRGHAEADPTCRAFTFTEDGLEPSRVLTRGDFDTAVRTFAARLQRDGLAGERALLVFEPGPDFVVAFAACLFAGVVPVPAYPPEPHRMAYTLARLEAIVADADPTVVIASTLVRGFADHMLAGAGTALAGLPWLTIADSDGLSADDWSMPAIGAETPAFLQYTSGSTGRPRGVVITHGGLMANLRMSAEAYGLSERSVFVSWLPQYHDMGLVGKLLNPLGMGAQSWLTAPSVFLRNPARWLELVSEVRGTITAAPNFGYDLAVRKTPAALRDRLDLSSLEVMVNGAEPVRRQTVERFQAYFAPAGLRPGVVTPSYGMAEVGLFVSCAAPERRAGYLRVDGAALEAHRVVPVAADAPGVEVTSCGIAWDDSEIEIVDPETRRPVEEGRVGEIWLAGDHVAAGYWRRPEETAATFSARIADAPHRGDFLRTGDLGFLHDGELYVTGRRKDVVIVRGRNLYPHDIERTQDASRSTLPEVRPGCAAAVAVEVDGAERLVIFQEIDPRKAAGRALAQTAATLRAAVADAHGVAPYAVVLLARGSLPKTSSGKVMRFACRRAFAEGLVDDRMTVLLCDRLAHGGDDTETVAAAAPTRPEAARLQAWMIAWLARELETAPAALKARVRDDRGAVPFSALGVDSLIAVQLIDALEDALDRALPADVLHTHGDIDRLTAFLLAG